MNTQLKAILKFCTTNQLLKYFLKRTDQKKEPEAGHINKLIIKPFVCLPELFLFIMAYKVC